MDTFALKGLIVHAPALGTLASLDGYIVCKNGRITGLYETLPEEYAGIRVEDFGDKLVIPAFSDLHLHAPQYPMLGTGMDLQLLEWLEAYTFPTEALFANEQAAREVYGALARQLVKLGTTRVSMFSSVHRQATLILMEELERAGIVGYVGKVNMDRNCPEMIRESTEASVGETLAWLTECEGRFEHIHPILTPRFTPSCSDDLMRQLGEIAAKQNLRVQSHLSENVSEIDWVRSLTGCTQYYESYARFGLFKNHTLMAHCVHSDEKERAAMREGGVWVVHCPDSNANLASGIAPVRSMLNEGVRVVLGSDIAGGALLNMMDVLTAAIRASKHRYIQTEKAEAFLTVAEAFYLATSAGAEYFGEKPGFAAGNALHALVIDDNPPSVRPLTATQRLERTLYLKGSIMARFSEGRRIGG